MYHAVVTVVSVFPFAGLVDGYATEKRHLEDNISGLEEKRAMLVVELERSQSRLSELQEAELTVAARQAELERQKEALEASVGMEDQGTLVLVFEADVVWVPFGHGS